jgi:hypothetical protein
MNHDVFISYSRTDAPVADDICKALDEAGISYWIDRGSISSGDAFHAMIVKAIRESKITIFVSSVNSNMSEYTIKEIVIAFKNKKHIIPFCLDENPYADKIEFYLCDLDQLQYYLYKEFAIRKLVDDLNRLLGKKDADRQTAPEKQTEANIAPPSYILKIRPNRTCMFFVDDEPRAEAPADKITRLPLNRGAFRLEFVSTENENDRYVIPEYILADPEQLLAIDLESIKQERERKEKEEKERKEKETIEKQEPVSCENESGKNDIEDGATGDVTMPEKEQLPASEPGNEEKEKTGQSKPVPYRDESGKYGYKNSATGDIVIKATYRYATPFIDDLAHVELSIDNWGFIDRMGKVIVPFKYNNEYSMAETWSCFSEGLAHVKLKGKWGFVDRTGQEVIPFKYEDAWQFSGGLAAVKLNGKWGFIDRAGQEIIPFKYDSAKPFSEGLAAVKLKKKWGFIDRAGEEVIPFKYYVVYLFSEGLAGVTTSGFGLNWGFIDKTGEEVFPSIYSSAMPFGEGLASVSKSLVSKGFIDRTGKEVIPFKYEAAICFSEGLAAVKLKKKWGFIDRTGEEIIPFKYDEAGIFEEGLASFKSGKNWGYIDRTGKEVSSFKCNYDNFKRPREFVNVYIPYLSTRREKKQSL